MLRFAKMRSGRGMSVQIAWPFFLGSPLVSFEPTPEFYKRHRKRCELNREFRGDLDHYLEGDGLGCDAWTDPRRNKAGQTG